MRVEMFPADQSGCGLYRMIQPGRVAQAAGVAVNLHGGFRGKQRDGHVVSIPDIDADVVVLQRPFSRLVAELIPFIQAQGVAVVVELDDDVQAVDPGNWAHRAIDPSLSPDNNWRHVMTACAGADWVTVSTPELRRYAPHGRVSVIPNTMPRSVYDSENRAERHHPVRVGWTGAVTTHPRDLMVAGPIIGQVVRETGAEFVVVGSAEGVAPQLGLHEEPRATGWVEINMYPHTLRGVVDIGIVPLADTRFNSAKSHLKGLEMASLGIPFVASPVTPYKRLHAAGIGLLAKSPRDWRRHLTRLIGDESYAREVADVNRAAAREQFCLEDRVGDWVDAWTRAQAHRATVNRPTPVAV